MNLELLAKALTQIFQWRGVNVCFRIEKEKENEKSI